MADQLDTLLSEERRFPPCAEFAARAVGTQALYDAAARDRLAFWAEQARRWTGSHPGRACSPGPRRTPDGSTAAG